MPQSTALFLQALIVTCVTTGLVIPMMRRWGVVDAPGARSSHRQPTPTGGGIGLVVGVLSCVLAVWTPEIGLIAIAALVLAALGLCDDLAGLTASFRLAVQVLVGVVVLIWLPDPISALWWVPALVWFVGFVNAFNFMDGINGISSITGFAIGVTWLVLGVLAGDSTAVVVGSVLAGACTGFLPWNLILRRVFMGDVGSYFLGALIAVGALALAPRLGILPVVLPAALYVVDTAWTLLRRWHLGRPLMEAHRDHTYQQLVLGGWSHGRTSMVVGAFTAGLGVLAVSLAGGWIAALTTGLIAILLLGAYEAMPMRVGAILAVEVRKDQEVHGRSRGPL